MTIELTARQVRTNLAVFEWCIRGAKRAITRRHYIQATRWCQFAAETAGFGCGILASQDLESLLLEISAQVPTPKLNLSDNPKKHRLHVMTRTDRIGGHNALVKRWIELNPNDERHSIVVLQHQDPDETELQTLVESTGGAFTYLGDFQSRPLECAFRVRELAWSTADYVVLHHHMWDVIPALAFGVQAGPPVFILNMADHLFWTGVSVADLVLQLRSDSTALSATYRGVDRSHQISIPLPNVPFTSKNQATSKVREDLGIPSKALVYLTVGRESKYESREGIDFISSAMDLLNQLPSAYLVAVGPAVTNPAWKKAQEETNGRLIPAGTQRELSPFQTAADIYLEGFPFGSLTALLEAGLAGLPCIRAPGVLPAVFRSTGPAIDDLPVPADTGEYVRQAVAMGRLPLATLSQMGAELAIKVDRFHRNGWADQIARIPVPDKHQNYSMKIGNISLPLNEAKMLRWMEGDALRVIRWKAEQVGTNSSFDIKLFGAALRQLPNLNFLRSLLHLSLKPSNTQPQINYIS